MPSSHAQRIRLPPPQISLLSLSLVSPAVGVGQYIFFLPPLSAYSERKTLFVWRHPCILPALLYSVSPFRPLCFSSRGWVHSRLSFPQKSLQLVKCHLRASFIFSPLSTHESLVLPTRVHIGYFLPGPSSHGHFPKGAGTASFCRLTAANFFHVAPAIFTCFSRFRTALTLSKVNRPALPYSPIFSHKFPLSVVWDRLRSPPQSKSFF